MSERTRRIARTAGTIAAVLLVSALTPKVLALVLDTSHPLATITSSSMWPELRRGDLVLLRRVEPSEIEPGMIVAFEDPQGQGIIIHRVVEIEDGTIVTQGDANVSEDEPVPVGDVIGAVPTIGETPLKLPYLGFITLAVRS